MPHLWGFFYLWEFVEHSGNLWVLLYLINNDLNTFISSLIMRLLSSILKIIYSF